MMRKILSVCTFLLLPFLAFSQEEKKVTDYVNTLKKSVDNLDYSTFRKDYFFTFEDILGRISKDKSDELNSLIENGEVTIMRVKMELESQCMRGFKSFYEDNALLFQKNAAQVDQVFTQIKTMDADEIYTDGKAIDALIFYNSDTGRIYTLCHDMIEVDGVIRYGFFNTKKIIDDKHYTTLVNNFNDNNIYEIMYDTYSQDDVAVALDTVIDVAVAVDSATSSPYPLIEKKYVGEISGQEYQFMFSMGNGYVEKVSLVNKDQTLTTIESEFSYCTTSPLILKIDDKVIYVYPSTNGSYSGSVHLQDNNQVLHTVLLTPILK